MRRLGRVDGLDGCDPCDCCYEDPLALAEDGYQSALDRSATVIFSKN